MLKISTASSMLEVYIRCMYHNVYCTAYLALTIPLMQNCARDVNIHTLPIQLGWPCSGQLINNSVPKFMLSTAGVCVQHFAHSAYCACLKTNRSCKSSRPFSYSQFRHTAATLLLKSSKDCVIMET